MTGKRLIFFILSAFIAATIFLIYIQSNSAENINALITGNNQYAAEYKVNLELKQLERNVINMQSIVRRAVTTGEVGIDSILPVRYISIDKQLRFLQTVADDRVTETQVDIMDSLVRKKMALTKAVMQTLRSNGTAAAQSQINQTLSIWLTDSLSLITENIENSRHLILTKLAESNAKSGQKALRFNSILIGLVLVSGAGLFWYIIHIIQKQISLIQQLNVSEKKVTESALLKEKFMANMSHEIRTPMNAVLGFTNLLRRKQLDDEAKEYVNNIQKSGEMLLTIINDILDLSKIEAGMMRVEQAPFNLGELAHSIEIMFVSKAAEKNLGFKLIVDESIPYTVLGDPTRLTQIMVNLIGNAIKFTESGSVTVSLKNEGVKENTTTIGIVIADTGIGVQKEKLSHIFDRFQQAEDSVTRKYGGTGLGLAIVNDLVKLQNGIIKAESEFGKGTTFHVQLPYLIFDGKVSTYHHALARLSAIDFTYCLILVVEDNEVNQSLFKHLFKSWNLKYELVNNGREAIDKLRTKAYDLILMDIQMPEMDGYTAAKAIRADLKLDVPIVAMTAHALAGEREKCLGYGMNEYISKPIREEQLRELIARFTDLPIHPAANSGQPAIPANGYYQTIDLTYLKEVSSGNTEYEGIVTGQFLQAVPRELEGLENAWKMKNTKQVQSIAHNLKTTVSVMGLNEKVAPYLDTLEADVLTENTFYQAYRQLKTTCDAALQEAKQFAATF